MVTGLPAQKRKYLDGHNENNPIKVSLEPFILMSYLAMEKM